MYGEVTPLFIKWMTSQTYNNNDVLLFPLQIWKQPHRIKHSDQFRVNKRDTNCFEHLYVGKYKALNQFKCLACLNFLINLKDFYGFYRREGRSDGILIEWRRDVGVLVVVLPPPHSSREEVCWTPIFWSSNPGVIWKITYVSILYVSFNQKWIFWCKIYLT